MALLDRPGTSPPIYNTCLPACLLAWLLACLSTYRPTAREIVACPRMHVLGVTAVPGRYSSWMVLNPLKCRVARLNINHSLYQPLVDVLLPSGNPDERGKFRGPPGGEQAEEETVNAIDRTKNLIGSPSGSCDAIRYLFVHDHLSTKRCLERRSTDTDGKLKIDKR